ncbi:MAG TPA: NYN domain-containing protein [Ignavibacteriaceae bacterium]|nr:NYN domain-containing protein [Ignavibacteriaceae bacterium]
MTTKTRTPFMKNYIIDGNNLIYKIKSFKKLLSNNNNQATRDKLAFMIDDFFYGRKVNVTLHFDGYESMPVKLSNIKIVYSMNEKADAKIKRQIDSSKNPRNIIVVSSDLEIKNFARVNGCQVLSSNEFSAMLNSLLSKKAEDEKANTSLSTESWEKLFGGK